MKFSLFSGIGLLSLSIGALAAPSLAPADALTISKYEKRAASVGDAYAITSKLYTDIQTHTGALSKLSYILNVVLLPD